MRFKPLATRLAVFFFFFFFVLFFFFAEEDGFKHLASPFGFPLNVPRWWFICYSSSVFVASYVSFGSNDHIEKKNDIADSGFLIEDPYVNRRYVWHSNQSVRCP